MSDESLKPLTEETAVRVLDIIAKGSMLLKVETAPGSFSNVTEFVHAVLPDGNGLRFVVRRYKVFGDYDRGEKARREFKAFELLNQHNVPAPEALVLDETGKVLGSPGIVTRFVKGSLMMDTPHDPMAWARKLARMLARIHSIPCGEEEQKFLLKGNAEAAWVVKYDAPPRYMQEYPGGAEVWRAMRELYPKLQADAPALSHIDYWSGNILWHGDEIAAVIDWEEAAYGDPAVDAAYARMNMILMGLPDAADEFIRIYESEAGRGLNNFGFWELAASVRPMVDPVDWEVDSGKGFDLLQGFIAAAIRKI